MTWQPIETAPKDGTPFLTFSRDAGENPAESASGTKGTPIMVMAWVMGSPEPINEDGDWEPFNQWEPTHWMPLPEPPK